MAPAAAHGGPYTLEVGQALQLRGTATDGNQACGDVARRRLGPRQRRRLRRRRSARRPGALGRPAAGLPRGVPNPAADAGARRRRPHRDRRDDADHLRRHARRRRPRQPQPGRLPAARHLRRRPVVPPQPEPLHRQLPVGRRTATARSTAAAPTRASPTPTTASAATTCACGSPTTWAAPPTPACAVDVNQGNQAPVARASRADYQVLEGETLAPRRPPLDRRQRRLRRPHRRLRVGPQRRRRLQRRRHRPGRRPAADPVGRPEREPALARGPANAACRRNTVTLRVRDTFGATSTAGVTVTIFRARRSRSSCRTRTRRRSTSSPARSNPTLDGRESTSPVPGVRIVRYDWDLNDDGTFEVANRPFVEFVRVFQPIPRPENLPQVFVRLRVTDDAGRQGDHALPGALRRARRRRPRPTPIRPTRRSAATTSCSARASPSTPRSRRDPDAAEFGDCLARLPLGARPRRAERRLRLRDRRRQRRPSGGHAGPRPRPSSPPPASTLPATTPCCSRSRTPPSSPAATPRRCTSTPASRWPSPSPTPRPRPAASASPSTARAPTTRTRTSTCASGSGTSTATASTTTPPAPTSTSPTTSSPSAAPVRVGLRVVDSLGAAGTTTVDMNVDQGNQPPVASAGAGYAIALNEALALDGRGSSDPNAACGDRLVRYDWDLNADGTFEFGSDDNAQQAVTWAQLVAAGINRVGDFRVALRVRDRFGVTTTHVRRSCASSTAPPRSPWPARTAPAATRTWTSTAAPAAPTARRPTFDITDLGLGLRRRRRLRDRTVSVSSARSSGAQNYTATLRVTDRGGRRSTAQVVVAIDVNNVAPVANAGGPYFTGPVGNSFAPVALDARGLVRPQRALRRHRPLRVGRQRRRPLRRPRGRPGELPQPPVARGPRAGRPRAGLRQLRRLLAARRGRHHRARRGPALGRDPLAARRAPTCARAPATSTCASA